MVYALINATVFTGKEKTTGKVILIENNKIIELADPGSVPSNAKTVDCNGYFISPGLIDLQIAGGGGFLFSENPTEKALEAITESILKDGTTGFLIAVPSNSFDAYLNLFKVLKQNPHPAILGLHLEGPYINIVRGGAHNRKYIKKPDKNEIKELLDAADGAVKMITLAPELCGPDIINTITDYGIVVAAGHSNATFDEARAGFEWGIKATTHLFNAMSQFHHREPGLPGATLITEGIYASIIADGIHVDYNTISIAKKIMKNRLYLVSDAVEENLEGAYLHTRQKDRFTLPDGTLSGSNLTMLEAVQNCVQSVGVEVEEALRMASTYPAQLIGLDNSGYISEGYIANLTVFDEFYKARQVIIEGEFYL